MKDPNKFDNQNQIKWMKRIEDFIVYILIICFVYLLVGIIKVFARD